MAEDKIPVLTEVYKPTKDEKAQPAKSGAVDITNELVTKVTAQVKPRLESEITEYILEELSAEIKKARQEVVDSTQTFVDKTKADLKTEMPKMYQDSIKLAQVDVEALKQSALDEAMAIVRDEMAKFQTSVINEYQKQINETLASIAQRAEASASEQVDIMHTRVGTMQQEAFAKLREEFSAEKDTIISAAKTEMNATLQSANGQALLKRNIEAILEKSIPNIESRLRSQLVADLQKLLQNAKLVLPQ